MSKTPSLFAATLLALSAPAAAQGAVTGPDATACRPGADSAAVLVRVDGFKARTGTVRVQVYGNNPSDFLAKGKRLKRIDLPVSPNGPMNVCVDLPSAGNYAVAVRHDVDGNGKSGWNDGGGFSRNPKISLGSLRPDYQDVVIHVDRAPKPVDVVLNYRRGLSVGPVANR